MNRERIERQIKFAQDKLAQVEKQLDADKVAPEGRKKQPKWRSAEADLRALKRRLNSVKAVEEREAACAERKQAAAAE